MKTTFALLSTVFVCGTLLFSSCKKKDDPAPSDNRTGTEKIAGHAYKITDATTSYNGSTFNVYSSLPACQKDNTSTFNANLTTTDDEGATKCNSGDPQTTSGVWALSNSDSQLLWDGETYTVLQNDGSILKLKQVTTSGSTTYESVFTMTKI